MIGRAGLTLARLARRRPVGVVGRHARQRRRTERRRLQPHPRPAGLRRRAVPSKRGTKPGRRTKVAQADVAAAQEQLDTLQWVIPALTGAIVVVSSYAGEQQRPSEVAPGVAARSVTAA